MTRARRKLLDNVAHHVTQRGNRKQTTFFSPRDYQDYLRLLFDHCIAFDVKILAFCLMPNHVHLILYAGHGPNIRRAVGDTHEIYTKMLNSRNQWKGHLWQGRFYSCPMSDSHLDRAINYVLMNPVRANLVKDPEQYSWSSANGKFNLPIERKFHSWSEKQFKSDELELFRKCSQSGRAFGEEAFFRAIEQTERIKIWPDKPGRKKIR